MLEFKKRTEIIKIEEKTFEVSFPNIRQLDDFNKQFKALGESDGLQLTVDFLDSLGLPKDVTYSLGPDQFHQIVELISGSQKKS